MSGGTRLLTAYLQSGQHPAPVAAWVTIALLKITVRANAAINANCGPCREEIPDLIKLQSAYPDDVAVLGIVLQDKFGEHVRSFAQEFGIRYPILDGNDDPRFEKAFGPFWGLPTSILIDRDGRIRKKQQGQVRLQQLEREIRALIPR